MTDHNVVITGDTKRNLCKKVAIFREQNGYNSANVEKDVNEYFCNKHPHFCFEFNVPSGSDIARQTNEISLAHRILAWAASLISVKDMELVDKEVARERASFCANCSHNVQYPRGCGSCRGNLPDSLERIRQKKSVAGAELLLGCDLLGWDNGTAVWLNEKHTYGKNPPADVTCWKTPRP